MCGHFQWFYLLKQQAAVIIVTTTSSSVPHAAASTIPMMAPTDSDLDDATCVTSVTVNPD